MQLGSVYLIVDDFQRSIDFYEKLLEMPVSHQNMNRFAVFEGKGQCISLMNAHFDAQNPEKVVLRGEVDPYFDDLEAIAALPNTRKAVLNFWTEDLRQEHRRVQGLGCADKLTPVKYVCNVSPYYYFQLSDPDGNVIEVTGEYQPELGELDV